MYVFLFIVYVFLDFLKDPKSVTDTNLFNFVWLGTIMLESRAFSGCIACEKFVFYCKQTLFKCVVDATR